MATVKRPQPIPKSAGYPGRIASYTPGTSRVKQTPYIRFSIALTGQWPDDIAEHDKEGVKLEGKTLNADYYLTEDALYRLVDLIKALGHDSGSIEENLPSLVGAEVLVDVDQQLDNASNEVFNRVNGLAAPQ